MDASPAAWLLATPDLTFIQIIQPIMLWKDVERFLLDKVWPYTKGDVLSVCFYIKPKFKNMSKTKLLRDGVRGGGARTKLNYLC